MGNCLPVRIYLAHPVFQTVVWQTQLLLWDYFSYKKNTHTHTDCSLCFIQGFKVIPPSLAFLQKREDVQAYSHHYFIMHNKNNNHFLDRLSGQLRTSSWWLELSPGCMSCFLLYEWFYSLFHPSFFMSFLWDTWSSFTCTRFNSL